MEPCIHLYNSLINTDSSVEQSLLEVKAPGVILPPDLNKYNLLIKLLFSQNCKVPSSNIYLAKSHDEILEAINNWNITEQFAVYNVDHHHDCGYFAHSDNEKMYTHHQCGNWVPYLSKDEPLFQYYVWISNMNSNMNIGDVARHYMPDMEQTNDITKIFDVKFDYVFICKSPGWIPTNVTPLVDALMLSFENFIKL